MIRFGRFLFLCGLAGLGFFVPGSSSAADSTKVQAIPGQVRIDRVEVRSTPVGPMVLLRVRNKAIPILVDSIVAESIHAVLNGQKTARPLSHELMHTILQALDAKVTQVVVTLKDQTFYGDVTVVAKETTKVFDSRSSDAVALAIHFKAPILVSQALLDSAGVELEVPAGKRL